MRFLMKMKKQINPYQPRAIDVKKKKNIAPLLIAFILILLFIFFIKHL